MPVSKENLALLVPNKQIQRQRQIHDTFDYSLNFTLLRGPGELSLINLPSIGVRKLWSEGRIWPATCLCMAWVIRMISTFLSG